MARPVGAEQSKPTRQDIINCYRTLKEKSKNGDVHACGWLIHLDKIEQIIDKKINEDKAA